ARRTCQTVDDEVLERRPRRAVLDEVAGVRPAISAVRQVAICRQHAIPRITNEAEGRQMRKVFSNLEQRPIRPFADIVTHRFDQRPPELADRVASGPRRMHENGPAADAFEMFAARPALSLRGVRLLAHAGGTRAGNLPPVVEDLRDVFDGAGAFGAAKHKVPILGTVTSRIERTDLLDKFA